MSTATAEAETQTTQKIYVPPFGIEADHPRNCDLLIQCVPNLRLRSAIDGGKPVIDAKTGDPKIPLDQARSLAAFPRTPGMQLHVNPEAGTYVVIDPLNGDEAMCERVARYLREIGRLRNDQKVKGVKKQDGTLDRHRMKSLCREMYNLVQSGEAKKCKGVMPTLEEINEMDGYYLLNPGSRVMNTQPQYEHQWDAWVANLSQSGG